MFGVRTGGAYVSLGAGRAHFQLRFPSNPLGLFVKYLMRYLWHLKVGVLPGGVPYPHSPTQDECLALTQEDPRSLIWEQSYPHR